MLNYSEPIQEGDSRSSNEEAGGFCVDDAADFDSSFVEDNTHVNDFDQTAPPVLRRDFSVLTESDIRKRQEEDITTVSSLLFLTRAAAIVLLRHHNWSVSKVNDAWFSDEARVRKRVGLFENPLVQFPPSDSPSPITCGICLEECEIHNMNCVSCGHPFCRDCWKSYISTSIRDGSACLLLKCPQPSCGAVVDGETIDKFATEGEREKFGYYLLCSYVEENRKIKWCPAPGCELVVEFSGGCEGYDVTCLCSYQFCWNCSQEAHRPVDCDTAAKWDLKNKNESENATWILAHTKPCPKCKRPIEKNQGCSLMTCRPPCEFRFCWLCLRDISDHRYASCNGFMAKPENSEMENRRKKARKHLEKYTHYYERWANNQSSRRKAVEDLELVRTRQMERLVRTQDQPVSTLNFLSEAWLQIIECRRVLQWTYAYGYYLPEKEKTKKQLFEYLQGQAELVLERLHLCAENELSQFLHTSSPSERFNGFRTKLIGLTKVTETHFQNLVRALENGLEEVDSAAEGRNQKTEATEAHWFCDFCANASERSSVNCHICGHQRDNSSP